MADDLNRKINIWINDAQVENTVKSLNNALRQSRNELAKMTIGSKEYNEQTAKIKQLNGYLDEHKKRQGQIAKGWKDIAKIGIGNLFANISTKAIDLAVSTLKAAFDTIKEFATGVSELKSLTGLGMTKDTVKDLELLKQKAKEMAAQYGKSAREVIDAMKLVGSARPEILGNADALSDLTDKVLILSRASGLDAEQSTQALTGALNQFNKPASDAGKFIDILANAAQKGQAEIPFLSDAVLRSGKIANDANLDFGDLATVLELLGPSFKSPELASSGLNRVLLNLQKDGLGYGSGKFSLSDAINDVRTKLNGMTDESKKAEYQNKVFGEGITVGKILLEKMGKQFDDFRQSIEKSGTALEQANENMNNLQGDLDKAAGAWDRFVLSIEDGSGVVSKVIRTVIKGFSEFLKIVTILNSGDAGNQFMKEYGGLNEKINAVLERQKKEIEGITDERERSNYVTKKEIEETGKLRMAELSLQHGVENGKSISKARRIQLEMEVEIYKKLIAQLNGYKDAEKNTEQKGDTGTTTPTVVKKTKSGSTDEVKKQFEEWQKANEDIQKHILDLKRKFNLEDLSEEQKAVENIEHTYQEKLDITDKFISELEAKQATKKGLNSEELGLLTSFYSQKSNLISMRETEIESVEKQFEKKKLEEKKKVEQQIFELTADATVKERDEIIKKYTDLINAAKLYGIETIGLYKKMHEELNKLLESQASKGLSGAAGAIEGKDIFGMTQKDWDRFHGNFEKAMKFADWGKEALSGFFKIQSNREQAALQEFEASNEKKKASLKNRLDKGLISQENYDKQVSVLDAKLDAKKKELAIKDAKRQKAIRLMEAVINTASAVAEALPNIPLSIIAGIMGGIQVGIIASEPLPKMASGARVNKRTYAEIGEAGPEIVLSNKIVSDPTLGPLADDLARIQEGKKPNFLGQPSIPNYPGMQKAIGTGTVNNVVNTSNTVINNVENKSIDAMKEEISAMKSLIKEQTDEFKKLKYLQAVITNDQLIENDEDEKLRKRYSGI